MGLEEHFLTTADGTKIYYQKSGAGEPLFLLHGNGGASGYFSNQVPILTQYFTVYVIDSRSHGQSNNASQRLDFPLMAQDLVALMSKENLMKVHLLGFSDGANLALVFTVLYPEKVVSLVLNAGNTLVSGVKWWANLATQFQYWWYQGCAWLNAKYKEKLLVIQLMKGDLGISEDQLHQITCPTLIIVGKHDIVKLRHSKYLARVIPKASFIRMRGEGHRYAKNNPTSFNQEVIRFYQTKKVIK